MPTVLITGANRGLGLELARQYAADEWRVIAACRNPQDAPELVAIDGDISVRGLDVTLAQQITGLAMELKGTAIDVLINNAGTLTSSHFGSIDYDAWRAELEVNLLAPMRMAEAFADHVAASDQKKLVSVSSQMGSIGNNTVGGHYSYRTSKAALNMAMRSLAVDLADRGIIVCALSPGWARTDMGGTNASITPAESVTGLRAVIGRLDASMRGGFWEYTGSEMPW